MSSLAKTQSPVVESFRSECLEQPERLAELFHAYAEDREIRRELGALKRAMPPGLPILWLGMGASFCSALGGAMRLCLLGRASVALEASEWLHFASGVKGQFAGPILVTTSGESAEMVDLARQDGPGPRILVSNASESPCWSAAKVRLPILAGPERANATKTYVNSTAVCTIIGSELAGHNWQAEVERVKAGFSRGLESALARRNEMENFCRDATAVEVIGRGPSLSGATMGALCVREMSGIRATAHSGGGFRHGPMLDVDSTHVAMILALGRTAELGLRLAKDCVARGGRVILAHSGPVERSRRVLPIPLEAVPEPWESLTSVLVSQALTLALIERFGTSYVRVATTAQ